MSSCSSDSEIEKENKEELINVDNDINAVFLSIMRDYPHVFEKDHQDHSDHTALDNAWSEISPGINETGMYMSFESLSQ